MTQLLLALAPEQHPSLENFVIGANAELHLHLSALTEPQSTPNDIYIWGEAGSGRSHLLTAALRAAATHRPAILLNAEQLQQIDSAAVPAGAILAIDDIETLPASAQFALFRLFNTARAAKQTLLIAGTKAPVHLDLREDLRTRIGQMLIYEVKALTEPEKIAALKAQAETRGMSLEQNIIDYLLRHHRRDIRSLLHTLDKLDQECLKQHRPATLPLLKEVMNAL